ncbi:MAG: peptidylprolyl isomerase, partial [Clostridia bacterium]|nr:peptidylprolyl isomerase [Clostridia bacterium]
FDDPQIAAQNISGAEAEALLMEVMQELVADKICRARAEALGFTDRTPEDEAQIDRLTDEAWAELLRDYRDFVDTTGMDAQQSAEAIERFAAEELSITRESLHAEISDGYWFTRLYDWATQDVAVSEEEIQAKYEAMVEEQRLRFESDPEDYGYSVMNGETIAWNPEGYRRVKHILLTFDDPQIAAQAEELYLNIVEAQSSGAELSEVLALQEALNELYSELDARAEEIEAQLRQGADFDQMIAQYGADENMNEEPWRSEGYPVSPQSTYLYSQEFIDACMTMEYIGQVSQPAHSIAGTHIIRYIGDVAPGAVPLESLREVVTANALSEQRDDAFTTLEAQWINEANVRYYPERLQ